MGKKGIHVFQEKDIFAPKLVAKETVGKKLKEISGNAKKKFGKQVKTGEESNIMEPWYKRTVRQTYWLEPSLVKRISVYCAIKGLKESHTVNRLLKEALAKIKIPKVED